ncbi:hypothetical protein U6M33_12455, partial [Cutibacterium acnes]|jgi:hypothetical protein
VTYTLHAELTTPPLNLHRFHTDPNATSQPSVIIIEKSKITNTIDKIHAMDGQTSVISRVEKRGKANYHEPPDNTPRSLSNMLALVNMPSPAQD